MAEIQRSLVPRRVGLQSENCISVFVYFVFQIILCQVDIFNHVKFVKENPQPTIDEKLVCLNCIQICIAMEMFCWFHSQPSLLLQFCLFV